MAKRAKHIENKEDVARLMEVRRKQMLVQGKIYPALVSATTSVQEAKALNQAISTVLLEEAMAVLKEKKLSDIKESVIKKLCEEGRETEVRALLDTMDGETLYTARTLIEGLNSVIEQALMDETKHRTLGSLEFEWDRMMQL